MRQITFALTLGLAVLLVVACGQLDVAVLEATPVATTTSAEAIAEDQPADASPEAIASATLPARETPAATVEPSKTPLATPAATISGAEEQTPAVKPVNDQGDDRVLTPTPQVEICAVRTDWPLYTVRRGDNLGQIANATGSTVEQLVAANCLADPDRLFSGQRLRVPNLPPDSPSPTATVQPEPWLRYDDALYQVSFGYPAGWRDVSHGWMTKLTGEDGFVQLAGASAPADLDKVAADQAFHKLLPYGSAPTIESIALQDGRQARLILPSDDQSAPLAGQGLVVAPYAQPIFIEDTPFNYLMVSGDIDHIRRLGESLVLPPPAADTGIDDFTVSAEDLPGDGKRLTFRWSAHGANRGIITSGTSHRFAPWWPVESAGELIVDVAGTIFPDPLMTLRVVNDVSRREAIATVVLSWACDHQYFFQPGANHCPREAALVTEGAYQPFEGGFMIWLPRPDLSLPSIYVFTNDSRLSLYQDTWSEQDQAGAAGEEPPAGLFEPAGGFGKVWREHPIVRDDLGWATEAERLYTATFQTERRESLPGIAYLTQPDGSILQLLDTFWQAYAPGQDLPGTGGGLAP